MNEAYFVGRKELLSWLNDSFGFGLERIEQTCTGACACQVFDCLYPGVVPLGKVNFEARFDYEYIKNYKILQGVFTKLNIPKVIEVNKLIKGKYQDNLEFLQWLKRFYDVHHQEGSEYDAVAKRNAAIKEYRILNSKGGSSTLNTASSLALSTTSLSSTNSSQLNSTITSSMGAPSQRKPNLNTSMTSTVSSKQNVKNINTTRGGKAQQEKKQITKPYASLQLRIENLERERDFYFQKLRDIELYTQAIEDNPSATQEQLSFMRDIQKILYATDEDFVSVDDDENMSDSNKENVALEQ
ncbi:hypothetical protein C9374_009731 [Naegleria lovaniensis]|uniref:Uncharacterized protein n=1 Tax=Naegleria lovaniensis TaxID=51637 RepID=A0AA88H3T9_NAELO|nr:uncharacterized protein C9374_009731 [Naegleria lovaniensis]KAG2393154.1 hypothetical protein C9374_009731 [Naegleria lovaniensis]